MRTIILLKYSELSSVVLRIRLDVSLVSIVQRKEDILLFMELLPALLPKKIW